MLPRKEKIIEELSSFSLVYVLVIIMVVLVFLFRGPISNTFSPGFLDSDVVEHPDNANLYRE